VADEEKNEETQDESVADAEPAADVEAEAAAAEAPVEEPTAEAPAEEPVAEAEEAPAEEAGPAEEPPAEEGEAPTEGDEPAAEAEGGEAAPPPTGPKAKPKRKPRSERRKRSKPKRERPETRKPITRLPKPEHVRGRRQERRGVVVSNAMDKTIVVKVETVKAHTRYKKVIRRSRKFHAHDEQNVANIGDVVRIVETRPLSATKNWRLVEVLEAAR
jgi:small subunit ribosomal protein S17